MKLNENHNVSNKTRIFQIGSQIIEHFAIEIEHLLLFWSRLKKNQFSSTDTKKPYGLSANLLLKLEQHVDLDVIATGIPLEVVPNVDETLLNSTIL